MGFDVVSWLVFWRTITAGRDPAPTLRLVQLVQRFVRGRAAHRGAGCTMERSWTVSPFEAQVDAHRFGQSDRLDPLFSNRWCCCCP